MALERSEWIWMSGSWVPWGDATVHVSAHALHYGSSVFEGIRAYATSQGPAIFRLDDHLRRLGESCKLLRLELGAEHGVERLSEVCVELVARNRHAACYIRPIVFRGAGNLGLASRDGPVEVAVFSFEWGRYLGKEAIEDGVDAAVSSWRRAGSGTFQPLAKIGGQYVANQLVSLEARRHGYGEGIMLDEAGQVSEGAGENLFAVFGGEIVTPSLASSILAGITRATVITLAEDLGITVRFETISRDRLYLAEELFMTGTAAEITPVRSVDRIPIGSGSRGPITRRLQEEFFGVVNGQLPDRHDWLTPVPVGLVAQGAD